MTNQYAFEIEGLQKSYNKRVVLNLNRLKIRKGKTTSLIGPSGAGKSTLLNLLGGMDAPDMGSIQYDGRSYPGNGKLDVASRREMAMVFQKPVMFNKNIYHNIAYGLKLRKLSKSEIDTRVRQISEKIGLFNMLGYNARNLSGGEMQRVALARAIVLQPQVLFMDEATTNLDPANVLIIEDLVRYAGEAFGTTVIMATHNIHQAKRVSERCIFLLNGELVEEGETSILLENPQNSLTRAFIFGDMIC